MTILLEKAVVRVVQLPEEEQDTIATVILEELDDERWDAAFSASLGKLSKMAAKVRQDIKAGQMKEMGFDDL